MITADELANAVNRLPDASKFEYDTIQIILHDTQEPSKSSAGVTTYLKQSTVTFAKRKLFGTYVWSIESVNIN